MVFGQILFCFSGFLQVMSGLWFWYLRDQTSYLYLLTLAMIVAIGWIAFNVPESPLYLYEKRDFMALRESLTQVALIN